MRRQGLVFDIGSEVERRGICERVTELGAGFRFTIVVSNGLIESCQWHPTSARRFSKDTSKGKETKRVLVSDKFNQNKCPRCAIHVHASHQRKTHFIDASILIG